MKASNNAIDGNDHDVVSGARKLSNVAIISIISSLWSPYVFQATQVGSLYMPSGVGLLDATEANVM